MNRLWSWAVLACALATGTAPAASPPPRADRYRGTDALARQIDQLLEASWKSAKIVPAAGADDAEWLRRVYLDLAGRIPSVSEVRVFLADRRPERRARLVEQLLSGPRFVTHQATVWRGLLLPEAGANFQVRFQVPAFERWLEDWLSSERGYDVMVRELLTAPIDSRRAGFVIGGSPSSPSPFYAAKEFKPEEIASAVSRLFLGVNLGCAQCHNHPFAQWKREQFWSFTAFFSGIQTTRRGDFVFAETEQADRHELTIPGTEKKVKARYLDGKVAVIEPGTKARAVLADWLVSNDNPYFARALVNRTWAWFFGTGLVEPLDEMVGTDTEPSQPEVLATLTRAFVQNGYDLRWLMRAITATQAYQRTSRRSHASQDDPRQFARAFLRGLSPEQLFDSLAMATGFPSGTNNPFAPGNTTPRGEFLTRFANTADPPTQTQTSILQALTLMNGRVTTSATATRTSETLTAVCDAPFLDVPEKIEALYLAALSRKPTSRESSRLTAYVLKGGSAETPGKTTAEKQGQQAEALADVFWALLNSGEFILNH